MLTVEIAYARVAEQFLLAVTVEAPCSVRQVLEQSGILERCPEIDLYRDKVGIFSKPVALNDIVKDGDRIEIYRPLAIDPMQARRARAKRKQNP